MRPKQHFDEHGRLAEALRSLRERIASLRALVPDSASPIEATPPFEAAQVEPLQSDSTADSQLPGLLNEGPFGMALLDSNCRFLEANATLCRMLGYTPEEILTLGLREVTHPEDVHNCPLLMEKVRTGAFPHASVDERLVKKDGTIFWVQLTAWLIETGVGKPACSLAIIENIEERRQREAPRASEILLMRDLFENARDMVFSLALDGTLTFLNIAGERLTGYTLESDRPLSLWQLVAPEHHASVHSCLEQQMAGASSLAQEFEIIARDGRRIPLAANTWLTCRSGAPVSIQGIARDVTERLENERSLCQTRERLEKWVAELEERTREITLLCELAEQLRCCTTLEEGHEAILPVVEKLFPGQAGAIYAISSQRGNLDMVVGWGNHFMLERSFAAQECWALRRERLHAVSNSNNAVLCKHLHWPPPEAYLCIPIMTRNELIGLFHYCTPEGVRLTESRRRLAVAAAEHIAMGMSNLRHREARGADSIRDKLTGLFNQGFLVESLDREIRRALRGQRSVGLIVLDIDQFQAFIAEYGTEAGDVFIRELGGLIQTVIRKEDYASRSEGDRFVIILPQGGLEVAQQRAESLQQMVRDLVIHHRSQALPRLTASAGIAVFPDHGRTGEDLLKAAEDALLQSKSLGRNRATVATTS